MSGFLLDTNVPSEIMGVNPSPKVTSWMDCHARHTLYLSAVTIGEIRKGISLLQLGARRSRMEEIFETRVLTWFTGRILPVTTQVAQRWGDLDARRQLIGRPIHPADGMIAATAMEYKFTLVTRNTKDFEELGLPLLNPWD